MKREPSEAEIQVLIALLELLEPVETPNNAGYSFFPNSLEEAAAYFLSLRLDWRPAFASLEAKGCIEKVGSEYRLTDAGTAAARPLRISRPPIYYWYEKFYGDAPKSPAFAAFCEALYGKALCQDGFGDMAQVRLTMAAAGIGRDCRVLDLGCGPGLISEYLSDTAGAIVTGMDYSPRAIALARSRTERKADRLSFVEGDLDDMPFGPGSFDVAVSIDSLYMPNDLAGTLRRLRDILAPDGRIAACYTHMVKSPERRAELKAESTPLGIALEKIGLRYRTIDLSEENHRFLRLKRKILEPMRDRFAREGRSYLFDYLLGQSETGDDPYDPATSAMSRYLYVTDR